MRIWHHINFPPELDSALRDLDLGYKVIAKSSKDPGRVAFLTLDIDESNPAFPAVHALLKQGDHLDVVHTAFNEEEVASAEWLIAQPAFSIGYKVPRGDSWSERYYERDCAVCGVGWRQIAPFRVPREPRMQGNSFASFWGGFEILCIEKVVKTLDFENVQGYGVESVQINSSGEPSIDIMQLVVNEIAQPALIEENAEQDLVFKHVCPNCGRSWYDHYARGRMPLRRSARV